MYFYLRIFTHISGSAIIQQHGILFYRLFVLSRHTFYYVILSKYLYSIDKHLDVVRRYNLPIWYIYSVCYLFFFGGGVFADLKPSFQNL